jgi:hypothetical protein
MRIILVTNKEGQIEASAVVNSIDTPEVLKFFELAEQMNFSVNCLVPDTVTGAIDYFEELLRDRRKEGW